MVVGVNGRLLLSNTLEGIPRYIYETTIHMSARNPETTFIVYLDRKKNITLPFPPNVVFKTIYLPTRHPVLWMLWFEILLPFHLKRDKVDVFYTGDGYASLRSSVPQVMVSHDLAYIHFPEHIPPAHLMYFRYFVKKFHHSAKRVIAVSDATKSDIMQQYDVDEKNIVVAYNAVNPVPDYEDDEVSERIKNLVARGAPYFCFVGAIHPRKNIVKLCEAFEHFKTNTGMPHRLLLAGRYAWKSGDIQKKIESTQDVFFIGNITEAEKYYLYHHGTALVYLSLFEGFGIPILEAMRAGLPVITSDVSSMPEVAGKAALLAAPHDIMSMADAMKKMTCENIRQMFISAGYQRAADFSWDTTADIIYKVLEKESLGRK